MDFKLQNDKTREFYKQDFTEINKILKAARKSLIDGSEIDLSDIVYIVNVGGYIGKSVTEELQYAKLQNKKIIYHET